MYNPEEHETFLLEESEKEDEEISTLVEPFIKFFKKFTNYDLMPTSNIVVAFDLDAKVKEAFRVAVETHIQYALLWDSTLNKLAGLLTVTDLIDVLIHYYNNQTVIKDLVERHTIRKWREIGKRKRPADIISAKPDDSLWVSLQSLDKNLIKRILVMENNTVLHVANYPLILCFMANQMDTDVPLYKKTIYELSIGTYSKLITATPEERLLDVVKKLSSHSITAVPIVDSTGTVINVYSRTDVMYITKDFDLDQSVQDALKSRPKIPVYTCEKTDSLFKVVGHLSKSRIHRLIIVDGDGKVQGIVSVSDIIQFFLKYDKDFN